MIAPNPLESVHLRRTDEKLDEVDALLARFGGPVGIDGVLDHLNRQAVRTRVPGRSVTWGFRWNDADNASARWWPQGISTSADATDTEDIAGREVIASSAYSKTIDGLNKGSRVTFVDLDSLRYRHVLLVVPTLDGGRARMQPLRVHAGGIVWCGQFLHVAGTRRGLFTCRVDDIVRVEPSEESLGYRYVLPVRFTYDAFSAEHAEPMRYSFLSLDRSADPPQLIAGEYGVREQTRRLVHYPLDPETLHLHAHEDGLSRPTGLHEDGVGHMQGAAIVRGTWYVTRSRGRWRLGHLYVGTPGAFRTVRQALPVGPEDITYWPSTDQLWSQTEYPGRRYVFAIDRSRLPAAG